MGNTYTRTISTSTDSATTLSAANAVAANLRAAGNTVTIGETYENVTVRHYGMASVDMTVTEPDPQSEVVEQASITINDEPVQVTEVPSDAPGMTTADLDAELAKDEASFADVDENPVIEDETVDEPVEDEPTKEPVVEESQAESDPATSPLVEEPDAS